MRFGAIRSRTRRSSSLKSEPKPRTAAAEIVLPSKLRMIWWSMVGPITRPPFSGELLGPEISHWPSGDSTSASRKNSDAPFIKG